MRRRTITRDGTASDGAPAIGRGYEFVDDDGEPVPSDRLAPGVGRDVAVVDVRPATVDDRRAVADPAFRIDHDVVLAREDDDLVVRSADGRLRAGHVPDDQAAAAVSMLDERPDLVAWVAWEWLREDGRAGLRVAISEPGLRPQPLAGPSAPEPAGTRSLPARPLLWVALAITVVVAVVIAVQI